MHPCNNRADTRIRGKIPIEHAAQPAKLLRRKQRAQVIVALGISAIGAALDRQFLSRSSFQYFFESQSAQSDIGNPLPRIVLE